MRTRGTIGGSVASGDPSCDWPSLLHTLDAEIQVQGPNGARTLDINGFVRDLYETVLETGDIITGIRFAKPAVGSGGAYCAFKRCAPAYPTTSIGVQLSISDGRVETARVALGSSGLTPIRAKQAEAELEGQTLDDDTVGKAADAAVADSDPVDDQRGSADFKRQLIASLTRRAIRIAERRAGGEEVKNSHEYY